MNNKKNLYRAKGRFWYRVRSTIFLLPAWFAPHKSLRVFFHRLRGVKVGKNVEIGYFCIIGHVHPYMIHIDDGAVVTARTTILEHDNTYYYTLGRDVVFGKVFIRRKAFLGIGTVVLPGVEIGSHAIVGALSLVATDVPGYSLAAGAPAVVLRRLLRPNDLQVAGSVSNIIR
jgi:acetyltransferase-like isoleucine patch superfamily enzyme